MKPSKKIAHVITGLSSGGAEWALYNLLQGGLANKFDNHIISLGGEGTMACKIRELDVPVTALGMRGDRPSVVGLARLRRVMNAFAPNLIQGWMYHGNLVARLACTLAPGRPLLCWNVRHSIYDLSREKFLTRNIIRLNRFFSNSPNALLYNSQLAKMQHEKFGFASQHGLVIPNGINLQRFCYSDNACKPARSALGIPVNAQVLGHVARLHPMKDHPLFLRVAVNLAQRHQSLHVLLMGSGVSLENKLLAGLVPSEVRDRFHLLGERDDVSDLMSAMDVFCLSSAWGEGFPNVLGEAMAMGVPCVATDVGDSALVIGNTGAVVPVCDEKALSAAIEGILTLSTSARLKLAARARNRIESNYTIGEIAGQYAALYERLLRHE